VALDGVAADARAAPSTPLPCNLCVRRSSETPRNRARSRRNHFYGTLRLRIPQDSVSLQREIFSQGVPFEIFGGENFPQVGVIRKHDAH
jgi:hypothetical protein